MVRTTELTSKDEEPDNLRRVSPSEAPGGQAKGMEQDTQSQKESELIEKILTGDYQLYHQLVRPYERYVYIVTLSYLRIDEEAEEAAREAFIRAFRDLRTLPGDVSFGMWLIRIALEEGRKRSSQWESTQIVPVDESKNEGVLVSPAILMDWQELPSEVVEHDEVRNLLRRAVERLPDACRQVFFLRDATALKQDEIAKLLEMDISQVKAALHRARIMLQSLVAPALKTINIASTKTRSDEDEPQREIK